MAMHSPPHPGEFIIEVYLEPNGLSGRELAAKPVAGEVGELVDCVRGAESALQQATTMLDAVDSAASDIRRAVATLPSAIEDIHRGSNQAGEQLAQGGLAKSSELAAARDAAV